MTELIKVIVSVKDPFTLLAFFAIVLLIAFRTKKVPELVFRLLGEKIGRTRFYVLLNRMVLYSFAVFLVLCGIAVLGQVLGYKTAARVASVEELKAELALITVSDGAARRATAEYAKALALDRQDKLGEAIESLQASLKAVPTATARETLALLYQKAGNRPRAIESAEQAVVAVRESGGAVSIAKAERLLKALQAPVQTSPSKPCPADAGLIGPKLDLPPGGDAFETAPLLVPCVYNGIADTAGEAWVYYKLSVPAGTTINVIMRTRDVDVPWTYLRLHGPNGASLGGYHTADESVATTPIEYKAEKSEAVYVSVKGGLRGSAFEFSVR